MASTGLRGHLCPKPIIGFPHSHFNYIFIEFILFFNFFIIVFLFELDLYTHTINEIKSVQCVIKTGQQRSITGTTGEPLFAEIAERLQLNTD